MAGPPDDERSGDIWNDVPLFREIQRVLLSSSGPVNWELARQVGIASAAGSTDDERPDPGSGGAFEDAVRVAELRVAGVTGLDAPADLARIELVRRSDWVQRNIDGLRALVDPAAERIGRAFGSAQAELLPDVPGSEGMAQMLGQLSPLMLGAQVGSVLGTLAQQVFGRYDIALPRPAGSDSLLFVTSNIAAFEREWSLEPTEFRTWIAVHEVAHRFEFARSWPLERFRELLEDYTSTLQLDVEGLRRSLEQIDPSNPEGIRELLGSGEGLFGAVVDDEQRLKLNRLKAFMGAVEGYGDHVAHAIGRQMLSSYGRIAEAMRRYREGERVDPVLERMLGVEVERATYRLGFDFCDRVVELTDEATLARMWDGPDAMPSLPELDEPRLWLARTA